MNVLLIPNAIFVPSDMQKKFGAVTPALVPLGNLSMLENIVLKYKNYVDKVYVVCYEQVDDIKRLINIKGLDVNIIKLNEIKDLGYTIFTGLKEICAKNININKVYINFADSLLIEDINENISDFAYVARVENSALWTYFKSKNGVITDIVDKKLLKKFPNIAMQFEKIFVGVFGISNPQNFLLDLDYANSCMSNYNIDSFYNALKLYSKNNKLIFEECNTWYDVGHSESYFKAKSGVAARSFNTINIDDKRGILIKSSNNKDKLIDEIKWYLKLPNKIQYLVPRIYDYSLKYDNPYVSMEFYGYHTLHESYLYSDLPMIRWKEIFKKLLFIIEDMEAYKVVPGNDLINTSLKEMYITKTFARLDTLKLDKEFVDLFSKNILINNNKYESLDYYKEKISYLVNDIIIKKYGNSFNIIHGDLCFANILVEDSYNFMRLIDPRGSFGSFDIYGDSNYEMAKLLHSLEGKYDFIIEDLFDVSKNGNNINFVIFDKNTEIIKVFNEVFAEKLKNLLVIRLIEATLFLSMTPLHDDHKQRQYVMLATGIILLDKVIKDYEGLKNEK